MRIVGVDWLGFDADRHKSSNRRASAEPFGQSANWDDRAAWYFDRRVRVSMAVLKLTPDGFVQRQFLRKHWSLTSFEATDSVACVDVNPPPFDLNCQRITSED